MRITIDHVLKYERLYKKPFSELMEAIARNKVKHKELIDFLSIVRDEEFNQTKDFIRDQKMFKVLTDTSEAITEFYGIDTEDESEDTTEKK